MRRQLVVAAAAVSSMIVLAFAVPLGLLVRTLAGDRAVTNGERSAQSLAPVITTARDHEQVASVLRSVDPSGAARLTVFFADGSAVGTDLARDEHVERAAREGLAFRADVPGGSKILVPVAGADGVHVVQAFVLDDVRRQGVTAAWLSLGALSLVLIVVAVLMADRFGRLIVGPVRDLAGTAERLRHGQLDARVEPSGPPEIVEVGTALNQLAERIGTLLTEEREAVADLSHRLRTPVAAVRLDIDALPPSDARDRLEADADDLARAVDRLITEARRPVRTGVGASTDAVAVLRERADFWAALAEEQDRPWRVELPDHPLEVAVTADDLGAALDAVFGNLFAHTPDGTACSITAAGAGGDAEEGARIVVEDDGPGFPPDRDVLSRGVSGGASTGLGLDIVRRTAEASGGRLEVGAGAAGGARVTLVLGRPAGG